MRPSSPPGGALQALEAEAQLRDPPVRGNPFPPVGRPYDQHGQLWNGYPLSRPRGVPIARSDKLPYARPFPTRREALRPLIWPSTDRLPLSRPWGGAPAFIRAFIPFPLPSPLFRCPSPGAVFRRKRFPAARRFRLFPSAGTCSGCAFGALRRIVGTASRWGGPSPHRGRSIGA